MNLGSIYGDLDYTDRKIIIRAWAHYIASITRGIRLKHLTLPTHNTVGFLNATIISQALRKELNRYDAVNLKEVDSARRIKRLIKLVDGIKL